MYLVMAYRYGQRDGYSFPVGIFDTLERAKNEATMHRQFRGGKYDHKIYLLESNVALDAEEAKVVGGTGVWDIEGTENESK